MDLQEQYERLLRYCCSLTGNREQAEDIVQETYLRFWTSHSYRDTGKELAYLYTIARNLCMDEYRRPKTEAVEDYPQLAGEEKYQPDRRLEALLLQQTLEALPREIREVVVLRYINEMKVNDIARVVGMSRFAVHRRLREGLTRLKQAMEGEQDEG